MGPTALKRPVIGAQASRLIIILSLLYDNFCIVYALMLSFITSYIWNNICFYVIIKATHFFECINTHWFQPGYF